MASVRIDKPRDPRFKLLGALLGTSRFDAIGRMAEIWAYCIERNNHLLSEPMINAIGERPDFAELIIQADFGERVAEGVCIKGAKGRRSDFRK